MSATEVTPRKSGLASAGRAVLSSQAGAVAAPKSPGPEQIRDLFKAPSRATLDNAAASIQGTFRMHSTKRAFQAALEEHNPFQKVFDEGTGAFYYFNTLTNESSWVKPQLLKDRDAPITPRSAQKARAAGVDLTGEVVAQPDFDQADDGDDAPAADEAASPRNETYSAGPNSQFGGGLDDTGLVSLSDSQLRRVAPTLVDGYPAIPQWRRQLQSRFQLRIMLEEIDLQEYEDIFIAEGFADFESVLHMEEEDMDAMKLKTGHKRKLMGGIRRMREEMRAAERKAAVLEAAAAGDSDEDRSARGSEFSDNFSEGPGGGRFGGLRRDSLRGTQRKTNTAGVPALRRPSDTSGRSFLGTPGGGSASQAMPAADAPEQEITIKELFAGDGEFPEDGQVCRVHYTGTFIDGVEFESSRKRGRPFQFKLGVGQVVPGFDMAVRKMSRGMRARFAVPAHLGYGSEGRMPLIPPDTPLVFDVQLINFADPNVELTPRDEYDPEIDGSPRLDD